MDTAEFVVDGLSLGEGRGGEGFGQEGKRPGVQDRV